MTCSGAPREWNAATYDTLPLPHERWGRGLRGWLSLRGDERVLDVGAGTGRDTEALLELVPQGHVVAVDGSAVMLTRLRERLSAFGPDKLTVRQADLREPLMLDQSVDVVFSVATLHWLPDHAAVFRSLASVLHPGGLLLAEWGGSGNLANVDAALADIGLHPVNSSLTFASVDETASRLAAAGLVQVEVALVRDPARLEAGPQFEAFLATVVLGAVLDPLPQQERLDVVRAVASRLQEPEVDYVRLQVSARQPERR